MKRFTKEQILMLHSSLARQTGGIVGVRDYNLLESAVESPFQAFGGEELYPTMHEFEVGDVKWIITMDYQKRKYAILKKQK